MRLNQYRALVDERKRCRLCTQLTNPSVVRATDADEPGHLDCDEIGPYSQWHHDLNATLLVVAKDFAPVPKFICYQGWPGSDVATNKRLSSYLSLAGFQAGSISASHDGSGLFFTNAVLCLPGGTSMRTTVRQADVKICSARFLSRIISLLKPKAIAALGYHATNAVVDAGGLAAAPDFSDLVNDTDGCLLPSGPRLFAMWHPVASRTTEEHQAAWSRLGRWLQTCE